MDGSFELFQQIGAGRFRKYTGSWELSGGVLSGKYRSGKAWGSSYEASVNGDALTLVSTVSGETDTYTRTDIPSEVRAGAYEL